MVKHKIELSVTEDEKILLCKALDFTAHEKPARNAELYDLDAKIELAWSEGSEREKVLVDVKEKLQTLRGYLFRLKGFLEAEAAGYPRVSRDWTTRSLEIVKALQLEV